MERAGSVMCGDTQCLVKRVDDEIIVIPARCKCWHCEDCRPARVARLKYEARLGKPNLFVTLTWRVRAGVTPSQAAVLLAWAWRVVRAEYLRAHGPRSLDFLAVFEDTEAGWPHIHIVARCRWLDHAWLKKRMGKLIGSPVVWVTRIKGRRMIANYVAKYIGKNPHRFAGTKRYWRSLRYLKPRGTADAQDERQGASWEKIACNWRDQAGYFERAGFLVEYLRNSAIITRGIPP